MFCASAAVNASSKGRNTTLRLIQAHQIGASNKVVRLNCRERLPTSVIPKEKPMASGVVDQSDALLWLDDRYYWLYAWRSRRLHLKKGKILGEAAALAW
jgi:hypothetical protein